MARDVPAVLSMLRIFAAAGFLPSSSPLVGQYRNCDLLLNFNPRTAHNIFCCPFVIDFDSKNKTFYLFSLHRIGLALGNMNERFKPNYNSFGGQ